MTGDVELFSVILFAICLSSLAKHLCISFTHFYCIVCFLFYGQIFFPHFFVVVQVRLSPFSLHHSPLPNDPHFPPLSLPPFSFLHVSFIHVFLIFSFDFLVKTSFSRHCFCNYFLLISGLSFYSLNSIIYRAEPCNFDKVQLTNFSFYELCFGVICERSLI